MPAKGEIGDGHTFFMIGVASLIPHISYSRFIMFYHSHYPYEKSTMFPQCFHGAFPIFIHGYISYLPIHGERPGVQPGPYRAHLGEAIAHGAVLVPELMEVLPIHGGTPSSSIF